MDDATWKQHWEWWQAKLEGQPVQANEGNPHAGFYRWPRKPAYGGKRTFTPVAYWPDSGDDLNCMVGTKRVTAEYGRAIWVSVCNHPVAENAYRDVTERNQPWPDEHELVPMTPSIGHNQPPDENSFEGLKQSIEDLAAAAATRLKGEPLADKDEADRIGNLADGLAELWKKAKEAHAAEKKPHDEALDAIKQKWSPLIDAALIYRSLKDKLVTPWLNKRTAEQKEAIEAAVQSGEPPPEIKRPRVGTRGRAMTLKSVKYAEITDYTACLDFFKDSTDIRSMVQNLANRAVRSGVSVPGATVKEETKAV